MVRLYLLGGLRLEHDGAEIGLASLSRKARLLLAMLALDRRVHGRSELAGRLWPDVREASARVSLRTALAQLRAGLHPVAEEVLRTERDGGLALADGVWTDVGEVARLLASGDAEAALDRCEAVLLPGLDEDWVLAQRDELRERLASGLGAAASAAEDAHAPAAAVRLTRRMAALDPLAETPHRELIRRLAAAGDRGAALTAYDGFRERLADALHIVPSAATRGLVEEIRSERGAEATPIALPSVMPAGAPSRFVGREPERRLLAGEWEQARGGVRRFVALSGEPGIGKTRLAAEFSSAAHADGGLVLLGRCHEDALIPYEPFAEALRRYAAECPAQTLRDQVGPHGAALAALVPELGDRPDEPGAARLVEAIVAFVREAAGSRPAVLVLEDVHWAEDATAVALRHLVRGTEGVGLLIIVTYRGTEVGPGHPIEEALAEARRARVLIERALGGLDEAAVGAIVAAEAGADVTEQLLAAVHARSEGNPFFVEELVRAARGLGSRAALALPRSIKDLLERRLRGLPQDALRLIETAAVIGTDVPVTVLAEAADRSEEDVVDGLDAASRASVIIPGPSAGTCSFAHSLVRETVYASLSDVRRGHLHRRVGLALEAGPARPAELARHFAAAGDHRRALREHLAAAREASGLDAFTTGLAHCDAALESARLADTTVEVEALVAAATFERGRILLDAGWSGELEVLEKALAGARAAGDGGLETRILIELGQSLRSTDAARSERALRAALALAERRGDVEGQVRALSRNALVHVDQLKLDRAVQDGERALSMARTVGDELVVAQALDALKLVWCQLGEGRRLAETTAELETTHRRHGELGRLCWTLVEAAQVPMAALRWDEADAVLREALAIAEGLNAWGAVGYVLDSLATVHEALGEPEAALDDCDRALELFEHAGLVTFVGWVQATAGLVLVRLRAADRAVARLDHGLAMAERSGSQHEILRCSALLARACWLAGDRARALQLAERAEGLCGRIDTPPGYALLYVAPAVAAAAEVLADAGLPERGELLVRGPLRAAHGKDRAWFAIPLGIAASRCHGALDEADAAERALAPALGAWRAGTFAPAWAALRDDEQRAAAADLAGRLADPELRAGLQRAYDSSQTTS